MLTLLFVLSFAGGPEAIPVQRPSSADSPPTTATSEIAPDPEPVSEPAPAPAPEPVVNPQPAPEPLPEPEPEFTPARPEAPPSIFDPLEAPARGDYVRVREPKLHGSGMIGVGATAMGVSVLMQGIWAGICGDPFCEMAGIHQRLLIGGGLIFISAGAYKRGEWNAYRDTLADAPMPAKKLRAHKIAGWTLGAAGLIAFGTDFAFHSQCAIAERGPNVNSVSQDWWGGVDCKGWASAAVMNLSGAAAATGFGLAFHATKYGRDRRFYRGARIAAAPSFGRDYVGVGLSGRF